MGANKMQQGISPQGVRDLDPNVKQRRAADPSYNIWVNASAGTGKTKVLTDRVLRLLLPSHDGQSGCNPLKILCLTFTKAGAGEMILRVQETLSEWVVLPLSAPEGEKSLSKELDQLFGKPPTEEQISVARGLFNKVINLPGGLKIMTIHSFCQSVLARFPLEAGISPNMKMLEGSEAEALLDQAINRVFEQASKEKASPLAQALGEVARVVNQDQFAQLIAGIIKERNMLTSILGRTFGIDGLHQAICRDHNIGVDEVPEAVIKSALDDAAFESERLREICRTLLASKNANDRAKGGTLDQFLSRHDMAERFDMFDAYCDLFLTSKYDVRKTFFTKANEEALPGAIESMQIEAERLQGVRNRVNTIRNCRLTADLFRLGEAILSEYRGIKQSHGALDFDDQILKTLDLLRQRSDWVLYKLDQGIDHILVDEAQDTNPEQWQIVEALCSEFYEYEGGHQESGRTLFVVGDEKQSIYGFQRASPEKFSQMRNLLERRVQESQQHWENVDLDISFRTTQAVLSLVDQVFAAPYMREGVSEKDVSHTSYRRGQAGLAEIWPAFEEEKQDADDVWSAPFAIQDYESASLKMARHTAAQVRAWLDSGEQLPSRERAIQPRDILILVRTRNAFVHQLMRALKSHNIPVSGADRMVLLSEISIQDMLSALDFCLLPEDDLNLATLLRSPLIGFTEDQLYDIAYGREGSLWKALRESTHQDVVDYLRMFLRRARFDRPFEFFNQIYFHPCPTSEVSGLAAMKNRLGDDVLDPLQEFLNLALDFEASHIPALQLFADWMRQSSAEIKRESEHAKNEVRIMTVHGSKGLQAPVVILPDTARTGGGAPKPDERILWPDKTHLIAPIWASHQGGEHLLYQEKKALLKILAEQEEKRLLYVAMTRAEDRLYVGGYLTKKTNKISDKSWYAYVAQAFEHHPWCVQDENGLMRVSTDQEGKPDRVRALSEERDLDAVEMPQWLRQQAEPEEMPPRPFAPSRADDDLYIQAGTDEANFDDQYTPVDRGQAIERGNVIHKLLEILPVLPEGNRRTAAAHYLSSSLVNIPSDDHEGIIHEVFQVMDDEAALPFFNAQGLSEVPIVAKMQDGRTLNGVIDRLYVGEEAVWILDYKTGSNPPDDAKDLSPLYTAQMNAYAQAVRMMYPDKKINAAILWTRTAALMPVSVEVGD
ncbi:MAG: double-strand break repair helicase AddA [Alphaproteobacteria bacterium]|nr:double-strand break repair helicase AddA [Alphaproteobacteria bacterium]HCQ71065.1 double-strand break repair helicase AddA [Rhodospirillaceae bacterium]|tara:strand:- start:13024 stop:16542 length:3519 start_codon:yes stop_codon:yes gene_type:complete